MSDKKDYWDFAEKVAICKWEECAEIFRGLDCYFNALKHVQIQHFSECNCCELKCEGIIMPEGYCCIQGGRNNDELCNYCKDRE